MINRIIYISLCVFCSLNGWAQTSVHQMPDITQTRPGSIYYQQSIGNQTINPDIVLSIPQFLPQGNSYWQLKYDIINVKSRMSLKIKTENNYADFSFRYSLPIQVTIWSENYTSQTYTTRLEVNYDHAEGSSFKQIDMVEYRDGYKLEVVPDPTGLEITAYDPSDPSSQGVLTTDQMELVSEAVELQSSVVYEKLDFFNPAYIHTGDNISVMLDTDTEQIKVCWDHIYGAVTYDLEWTSVERLFAGFGWPRADFNNNAARVTLSDNCYSLPNVFEREGLLFRVRAKGFISDDYENIRTGNWSCSLPSGQCDDYSNVKAYFWSSKIDLSSHEQDSLNWQVVTSYAEEGKRKDVVTYMDGTMRSRQTVTAINSYQNVLVAETFYDHQGRPAIQALPAPVHQDMRLKYRQNFNQNLTGQPFSKQDFDLDNECSAAVNRMNDGSGASHYYSSAFYNNLSQQDKEQNPHHAYIPQSDGYPYVQTEYTADNTGRIARQGGAGEEYQLGSGHETKYYYGVPSQEELDLLFGLNVGYANHYKKNMVVDPNGQVSISYLDAKGNTIATALGGPAPDGLDQLDSYMPSTINVDLLKLQSKHKTEHKLNAVYNLLVENEANYSFDYSVSAAQFRDDCMTGDICYDCHYDLSISIVNNQCGTKYFEKIVSISELQDQDSIDFYCSSKPKEFTADTTLLLPIGSYSVIKSLSVNEDIADAYVEHYINETQNSCTNKLEEFLLEELAQVDTTDCNIECDDLAPDPENNTGEVGWEEMLCDTLPSTPCEVAEKLMLADFMPGGQYAGYGTNYTVSNFPLSILNVDNDFESGPNQIDYKDVSYPLDEYVIINGLSTNPADLSVEDYVTYYNEAWARHLLPYHPEYCYLSRCDEIESSHVFDIAINQVDNYAEAEANGWIDFTDAMAIYDADDYPKAPTASSAQFSPQNVGLLTTYYTIFEQVVTDYQGTGLSILQVATMSVLCPYADNPQQYLDDPSTLPELPPSSYNGTVAYYDCLNGLTVPISLTDEEKDDIWIAYRALYLSVKNNVEYQVRTLYAIEGGCYNECIGQENFNPFINGFSYISTGEDAEGNTIPELGYFDNLDQVCDTTHFLFYADKQKRFSSAYDIMPNMDVEIYDLDTPVTDVWENIIENVDQAYLDSCNSELDTLLSGDEESCHTLPEANDFQNFLNAFHWHQTASSGQNTHSTNASNIGPDLQIALGIQEDTNEFISFTTDITLDSIIISFYQGCEVVLNIGREASQFGTNNIFQFGHIQADFSQIGPDGFTDHFMIDYQNKDDQWTSILGYTNGCFHVGYCCTDIADSDDGSPTKPPIGSPLPWLEKSTPVKKKKQSNNISSTKLKKIKQPKATAIDPVYYSGIPIELPQDANPYIDSIYQRRYCPSCKLDINGGVFTHLNNEPCKDVWCLDSIPVIYTTNINGDCIDQLYAVAEANAYNRYDTYIDSVKMDVRARYMAHCIDKVTETFTGEFAYSQHHFTLYYYDQANNLVQTVPPNGVEGLNAAEQQLMADYRSAQDAYKEDLGQYQDGTISTIPAPPIAPVVNAIKNSWASEYSYNSLNQLTEQQIPDQGYDYGNGFEKEPTVFWYDDLGRLVASQNPVQATDKQYSYTVYDGLGRIRETGEVSRADDPDAGDGEPIVTGYYDDGVVVDAEQSWQDFISNPRAQITETTYDHPYYQGNAPLGFPSLSMDHLRGRVSAATYYDTDAELVARQPAYATHYSYDIHGNVKTLVQAPDQLGAKTIAYDYDLISGNVNYVWYQKAKIDQFTHRYYYDADNRLTQVQTSRDGVIWEEDARYKYYLHGPLARLELGEEEVQGLDYAYTLQGWIKGMNSAASQPEYDMGHDGMSGHYHENFARDEVGFILNYNKQDYVPVGAAHYSFDSDWNSNSISPELWNGNIRSMITSIRAFMPDGKPAAYSYTYDQLNRIKSMQHHNDFDGANNTWNSFAASNNYSSSYSYDANGNINTLKRRGMDDQVAKDMDDFTYTYTTGNNRLRHVKDDPSLSSNFTNDIDNQSDDNYTYDRLGNLTKDEAEHITSISWNLSGNVEGIEKGNGTKIKFRYDALGNRIAKTVNDTTTWYIRDASGNTMSHYESKRITNSSISFVDYVKWISVLMYGSSRLGMYSPNKIIGGRQYQQATSSVNQSSSGVKKKYMIRGSNQYELTNHLSNVLATVSDRKRFETNTNGLSESIVDVILATDYYPGGMLMSGRVIETEFYYYKHQGQESDNEVVGEGNSYFYKYRMNDTRLNRFYSVDPLHKQYPSLSSYVYSGNDPIRFTDVYGLGINDRVKKAKSFENYPYRQQYEWEGNRRTYLRTGLTKEALEYIDCSELVCRVLAYDGITNGIKSKSTKELVVYFNNAEKWHKSDKPEIGDIFLWRYKDQKSGKWKGHTGIVTNVSDDEVEITHAKGRKYGTVIENKPVSYFTGHNGWQGFFRPSYEEKKNWEITIGELIPLGTPIEQTVPERMNKKGANVPKIGAKLDLNTTPIIPEFEKSKESFNSKASFFFFKLKQSISNEEK